MKKWFTQGYGEKNMLINGTSAVCRPNVGGGGLIPKIGGGGTSKFSAVAARLAQGSNQIFQLSRFRRDVHA